MRGSVDYTRLQLGHPESGTISLLMINHNCFHSEFSPSLCRAGTLWKVECSHVPVEPGVLLTCHLPGRTGFVQTPKNKMWSWHQPASPLHRMPLFKFDNQNILQFEILVIWFSLVSSLGMKALRSLLKNLRFWWRGWTKSIESSINEHRPNLATPPRAGLRTQTHLR